MKIETVEHTDVRGKKLNYLKVSNYQESYLINVGEKTFNEVKRLVEKELEKTDEETADKGIKEEPKKEGKK